jgi:hypothetical protein
MAAPFNTAAGAASFSLSMSSWSVTRRRRQYSLRLEDHFARDLKAPPLGCLRFWLSSLKKPMGTSVRTGGSGASNTDPYATEETPDNNWIRTGSHVMIVGAEAKSMMQGYPRDAKPDPAKPYVMWPGTPYEHLMLPVK